MITASTLRRAEEISFEDAFLEIEKMTEVEKNDTGPIAVYSGVHPEHGAIHIVVPSAGSGLLLYPFAIQDF